ncbi:hypothetical protein CROQUDRAFT_50180 [Cronartium quercuum f. sp. fusiforme G11]|uniref:UBX domain-containing protein n=1 Tax=Cronartium quercuum f. sp. fusiforme G11 TaxID=708437 RepID=A0A9P6N9M6_9BASI|nr:hypothetical protein CROQUDRAFT_50180 [Cronartium quercuum f. sp. fusiforme G11]
MYLYVTLISRPTATPTLQTKNGGLQQALDWLEKNGDKEIEASDKEDEPIGDAELATTLDPNSTVQTKSLKCNDCNKIFANQALASYHADKSGHLNFEESTEEIKPLTEEEKKVRLAELRSKMDAKRVEKAKKEAEELKANEVIRRKGGKDLHLIKQELELKEAAKKIAQDKQDKLNEAKAKARVKAQIEEDKQRRLEKAAAEKALVFFSFTPRFYSQPLPSPTSTVSASVPVSKPVTSSGSARVYTEARLQLRLPDQAQQPLVFTLKAEQTLTELVNMLFDHSDFANSARISKSSVKFSTTFPRKMFSENEMTKPIKDLGLMPSAALIVTFV